MYEHDVAALVDAEADVQVGEVQQFERAQVGAGVVEHLQGPVRRQVQLDAATRLLATRPLVGVMHWKGNVLFKDALNTFYLGLYGVRHMVKDHSDSEKGSLLPPHGLLFPINSKGSFICTIPQTG